MGSYFPDLGLNPGPTAVKVQSLKGWTAREVPLLTISECRCGFRKNCRRSALPVYTTTLPQPSSSGLAQVPSRSQSSRWTFSPVPGMSMDWLEPSSSRVIYTASLVEGEETGWVNSIVSKERQHPSASLLGGEATGDVSWGPHGYIVGQGLRNCTVPIWGCQTTSKESQASACAQ